MPINVYWLLEHRVSYMQFEGAVTLDELREAITVWIDMLDASPDALLVHSVQDVGNITSFPSHLKVVKDVVTPAHEHPRMGWVVTVNLNDAIIRFLVTMVEKLTRSRQRFVDTPDDALAFLNQVDPLLPNLHTIDRTQITLVKQVGHMASTEAFD